MSPAVICKSWLQKLVFSMYALALLSRATFGNMGALLWLYQFTEHIKSCQNWIHNSYRYCILSVFYRLKVVPSPKYAIDPILGQGMPRLLLHHKGLFQVDNLLSIFPQLLRAFLCIEAWRNVEDSWTWDCTWHRLLSGSLAVVICVPLGMQSFIAWNIKWGQLTCN